MSDLGIAEGIPGRRDIGITLPGFRQRVSYGDPRRSFRDIGEFQRQAGVAGSIDMRIAAAQEIVDLDPLVAIEGDAGLLQTKFIDIGRAPDADEDLVGTDLALHIVVHGFQNFGRVVAPSTYDGIVKLTSVKQKRDARHVHCSCASEEA